MRIVDGLRAVGVSAIAHDAFPFTYIARNLVARRLTTALTAGGMALVVYVFATVLMLAAGLEQTLVATGQPTTSSSSAAARRPRCRAASTALQAGDRREPAGHRDRRATGGSWCRRSRSC